MKIFEKIKLIDLGILIGNTLVICDLHIGVEEAMAKQGMLLPKFNFKDLIKRMEEIFLLSDVKRFERIIINGDLKHEFGSISDEEWRHSLKFIDFMSRHADEVILIKGNHDKILGPIAGKRNLHVVDEYMINDILILHGDKLPASMKGIKTIIIGHEHPAITITEGAKSEKFKCYLVGKYKGKDLIVQPSMKLISEGVDVRCGDLLSPFLKRDISDFRVIVVGDRLYDFGKLGGCDCFG
ncbi:MAG: metallophosphoesterase [Nanoarchaeota archaeon]|nr:metallophosphoesterase [Nanoarchaeota archaeon]